MSTFDPVEFRNYQTGSAWDEVQKIKAVNIKPGKSNYHIAIVGEVLHHMYPHPNNQDMYAYDVYMEKAVKKYQNSIGAEPTGILTVEQMQELAKLSGKFTLV